MHATVSHLASSLAGPNRGRRRCRRLPNYSPLAPAKTASIQIAESAVLVLPASELAEDMVAASAPSSASETAPLHVVLFPWLAFGHLHAYLALAKSVARRGHRVSFVSTPNNIARLPPIADELAARNISFVALPLPAVAGLPEGAESTKDVPFEKVGLLKKALDGLDGPFSEFFVEACSSGSKKPDWVVIDITHHWLPALVAEHRVPCCLFLSCAALILPFMMPIIEVGYATPDMVAGADVSRAPSKETHLSDDGSGLSPLKRLIRAVQGCKFISTRSCAELESDCISTSGGMLPHVPVGMLPPTADHDGSGLTAGDTKLAADPIMEWLEKQPPRSVIYVALGTEAPLSIEFLHELALGLELSAERFIWALRKPAGLVEVPDAALLPEGFKERIHNRGLVTMSWVPQIKILAHGSVGSFLTHCGWNSVVEGLSYGQPFVILPIDLDQPLNARLLEQKRVGLRVPVEEKTGLVNRHGVADAVRRVMADQEDEEDGVAPASFRSNAKKLQAIVGDENCQGEYVDRFLEYLSSHKEG